MSGAKKVQSIVFKIDAEEIIKLAGRKPTERQVAKILSAVESDPVLWSAIEASIKDAINFVRE